MTHYTAYLGKGTWLLVVGPVCLTLNKSQGISLLAALILTDLW